MSRDKTESHKRVLAAAREEFMEYGFENASMRRIGERCGMTAAGLYRHCKDKAGLFEELVTPSIDKINEWLHGHVSRSIANMRANIVDLNQDSDIDMMRDLSRPWRTVYDTDFLTNRLSALKGGILFWYGRIRA